MLSLYNSLTRSKEPFEPLSPPFAGVYVCGPTVYGNSHVGHAKSYVSFDVLVRYMRYTGLKVRYVQNITDVGHLTDDADAGEDKIQKQARLERLEPMELVEKYTRSYFEDMDRLNNLRPDISPRASAHIPEQIAMVRTLLEKGHAYEADGNVYFSVESFPEYGSLSGRKSDDLIPGSRVAVLDDKRDPRDFALWKRAGEDHILRWNSPWGWGYPGWHLECSVLAMRYLGETIDIHGGGLENIFPHHECEVAQSEAATGKRFARFWMHNNMVTIDGQKMGKSLGNIVELKELFERRHPMAVRLYVLRSHYRSPLDFTEEGLDSAERGYGRLVEVFRRLASECEGVSAEDLPGSATVGVEEEPVETFVASFHSAMDDDLNTPRAIAALFDLVRAANSLLDDGELSPAGARRVLETMTASAGRVLGLDTGGGGEVAEARTEELLRLLEAARSALRKNGLFDEADRMRDSLLESGFRVEDLPDGESRITGGS